MKMLDGGGPTTDTEKLERYVPQPIQAHHHRIADGLEELDNRSDPKSSALRTLQGQRFWYHLPKYNMEVSQKDDRNDASYVVTGVQFGGTKGLHPFRNPLGNNKSSIHAQSEVI